METEKQDRTHCCYMGYVEISHVASFRENRLSDPSFRRNGPRGQRIVADRRQRDVEDSVPEAFWGNTRGWSVDLGRGPKQVEKTDPFRVPVLRFSTLGPACHPGAFPVQAPDKAPETSTWSPGSQGGGQLARPRPLGPACHPGAFPVQAPDKASETSTWPPGSQGGRQLARPRPLGPACHPGAFPVQAPDKAPETWTWPPGSQGGRQLARPQLRRQPDRVQAGQG